jgi:hypothetical protein
MNSQRRITHLGIKRSTEPRTVHSFAAVYS